ncbi:MAG TPA: ATP-binding cassette domain-containing protein, partial [Desulfurococcales archaeon]|nr:ATP-binding cassette domain-containing protein [Desulfurococcales archaeon]
MVERKTPIVEMRDIVKIYPDGTVALRGVSISLYEGEIVGLLGENGAGKTTLMKILSGFIQPTDGEIYYRGRRVKFKSTSDALALGIGMVHQHFTLVPIFTPLENIILGLREVKGVKLRTLSNYDTGDLRRALEKFMEETGLKVPLDVPVEYLPLGLRQRTEILKVLVRGVNVLILDEPTTFLTPMEVEELFKIMVKLKKMGKTVVFITHKIREALAITDRIIVLRRGKVVGEVETAKATPEKLAVMMVGKEMELDVVMRGRKPPGRKPVLVVKDLWVKNDLGVMDVKGISFEVYPGEIFGIAGVEGNGQDSLV